DHKSKMVEDIIPKIIEPINKIENLDENQKEALKELNNWDGVYTTDSKAASIFEYFYINFVKNIVSDEMGNELYQDFIGDKILVRNMIFNLLRQKDSKWFDNINTKDKIETFDDIVQISFINSLDSLKEKLGAKILKWNWGYIHTLTIKHPLGKVNILDKLFGLNKGPFAVGGTYHTVAPYAYKFTDIFNVNHGASERHIFSTADWNESLTIIPTGICGIPASDHYCDQTKLYINDKFHSDYFDLDKIKKISKYKMELLPVK
ncbi:MAG: penicillin acylase family protein, partial [Bacteroidales bacterium]|nr:penicillin acylase family protein [Bacteroidales bacterium]